MTVISQQGHGRTECSPNQGERDAPNPELGAAFLSTLSRELHNLRVKPSTALNVSMASTTPEQTLLSSPVAGKTERLSLPLAYRLPPMLATSFLLPFVLALPPTTRKHALIFRAENAHRLPSSTTGWYLYHRSKNYAALVGGVLDSLRTGAKGLIVVAGFAVTEEAVDRVRGRRDLLSSVVAGLGTAAGWSAVYRLPMAEVVRVAKRGLLFGLLYGGMQDALRLAKGESGWGVRIRGNHSVAVM